MSARSDILARLRAVPIASQPELPEVAAWFEHHRRHENAAQRSQRLREALIGWRAEVHSVSADDWIDVLLDILAAKGLRQLLIGDRTPHGEALAACAPASLNVMRYDAAIEHWQERLFDGIDVALTRARGAIAATGSLILWPDASEPRLMSLVPAVHVVLVDDDTIHADFQSALSAEGWAGGMPTNALLISGPSKTADIQQTLAYGAHGPRELVVLLRQTQEAAA